MKASITDALSAFDQLESYGRRNFLKISSVASIIPLTGGALMLSSEALAGVPRGIKFMTSDEYLVYQKLMQVMLPTASTSLISPKKVPVLQTLDTALLGTLEPHLLQGLKQGVAYFNDGPMGTTGKRFVQLSDADAARFCDTWANSSEPAQRGLTMGLKKLVGLAYWANPVTWPPLGYDGPVTRRWKLESYGNAPMPK